MRIGTIRQLARCTVGIHHRQQNSSRPLLSSTCVLNRNFRTDQHQYLAEIRDASSAAQFDFWRKASQDVVWDQPFDQVVDHNQLAFPKWFPGGQLNMCYNCVDRHVKEGRGDMVALVHDSPAGKLDAQSVTFRDLLQLVQRFAGVLRQSGLQQGDRVVIYCPMIVEAAVAMLACARMGVVHSVVFGGFASRELAVRIDHAKPKAVICASHGYEGHKQLSYVPLLEDALVLAKHKPDVVVVKDRTTGGYTNTTAQKSTSTTVWQDWDAEMHAIHDDNVEVECAKVGAMDPLYLLYTSGTTGQPKGIIRPTAGYAVALRWSMEHFMEMKPNSGDCYWAASDIGWVVGHSYCVYGPLINGNKTVLFEGKPVGTPDAAAYWRIVEKHHVRKLFTAPTALRAIRKSDPELEMANAFDLSSLDTLFTAGERGDPSTIEFFEDKLQIPVVDHYWQTETGWPICGIQDPVVGRKLGSSSKALPGFDVQVVHSETSEPLKSGELGDLVIKLPLPPGTLQSLYQADDRFVSEYLSKHDGYYLTNDAGYIDDDNYIFIMSRTDDVINTAGHRLSTGAMEEVLLSHPSVADCAVVGMFDELKGQVPVGFLVLNSDVSGTSIEDVKLQLVQLVRDFIGPVAAFKQVLIVDALPKTRSGKTLRNALRKVVDGLPYTLPGTVENPSVMEAIELVVTQSGLVD